MQPDKRRSGVDPERGTTRHLVWLAGLLCAVVFAADLVLPPSTATGVVYVVPVFLGLWRGSRRFTLGLALTCALLVGLGGALGSALHPGSETWLVLSNRALALFAVAIVARLAALRIEQEREIARGRERFAATLESIADAVVTSDPDGRVTFLNPVAERLLGWTRDEALGRPLQEVCVFSSLEEEPAPPDAAHESTATRSRLRRARLRTRDGRDFLVEGTNARLSEHSADASNATGRVLVFRDASERERYERRMTELAYRDALTGLPNRASLHDRLELELAHARRNGDRLALLYLDLDGFKAVNDELGHAAGDALLRRVADRLRGCLREGDTVARLGGDEFTVVLPRVGGPRAAVLVAEKIVKALGGDDTEPLVYAGRTLSARPSIGIALFPEHGNLPDLLRLADAAMYAAKAAGGGCWRFHRDGDEAAEPLAAREGVSAG